MNMNTDFMISDKTMKRMDYFKFTDTEKEQFSNLLEEANQTVHNGKEAKEFLKDLDKNELELVRRYHSLADEISNIDGLTGEGAYNLLVQMDNQKDFNDDAIVDVGKARTWKFPPVNSPQHVKDAWAETTKDMDFKEKMLAEMHFMIEQLTANIKTDHNGNVVGFYEPGDPNYKNPWSQPGKTMLGHVNDRIQHVKDFKKYYTDEQYKRSMDFLNEFKHNLEKNRFA